MTDDATSNAFIKSRRAEFSRLPDGGLLFFLPDEIADAIGWYEGDLIDVDVDEMGRIIAKKIDTVVGAETER